jgi:GMP synthase (glutamine-hydrolysing)
MTDPHLSEQDALSQSLINTKQEELILVLDFGSQTSQLITRRVREQNVFSQLARPDLSVDRIRELNPKGIILSGGPASVYGENSRSQRERITGIWQNPQYRQRPFQHLFRRSV